MPITEIPNSGYIYRVQQPDKDQASQQEAYRRRQKKKKIDDKTKQQEESQEKGTGSKDGRINLVV
jgi:hypothetical protein